MGKFHNDAEATLKVELSANCHLEVGKLLQGRRARLGAQVQHVCQHASALHMPQEGKASPPVLCSPRNETRYVGKDNLSLPILQDAQLRLEGCEWVVGDLSRSTEASQPQTRYRVISSTQLSHERVVSRHTLGLAFVSALSRVLLPTFGMPTKLTSASSLSSN